MRFTNHECTSDLIIAALCLPVQLPAGDKQGFQHIAAGGVPW